LSRRWLALTSEVTTWSGGRRWRGRPVALLLVWLILAPACSGLGGNPGPATIRLSGADSGSSFTAHVGDAIVVTLAENPSTGYRWDVDQGVGKVLALASSDYAASSTTPLAGAGGARTFTFRAQKAGGVHLVLKEWRPFEGDRSIVQRFDITVEVGS